MRKDLKNKLNICIVAVCYNAVDDALILLDSIEKSFKKINCVNLHVVLCDNSTKPSDELESLEMSYSYYYMKSDNVGYFPGFYKGLDFANKIINSENNFNYSIVTNVDLRVSEDFLSVLAKLVFDNDIGVIAPKIQSQNSGGDINPKILLRPDVSRLKMLKFVFGHQWLYKIYKNISEFRSSRKQKKSLKSYIRNIYAAHGSFMIFTQNYFEKGAVIDYPRFLFGEEVFVAEEARLNGLKIIHEPSLVIYDKEHGSTSRQHSKFIAGEHVKSYKYLIENYFNQ